MDAESPEGSRKKRKTAAKPRRSRAACLECHKAKQRCDGPEQIPCHRCKIHTLECVFPDAQGHYIAVSVTPDGGPTLSGVDRILHKLDAIEGRLRALEGNADRREHASRRDGSSRSPSRRDLAGRGDAYDERNQYSRRFNSDRAFDYRTETSFGYAEPGLQGQPLQLHGFVHGGHMPVPVGPGDAFERSETLNQGYVGNSFVASHTSSFQPLAVQSHFSTQPPINSHSSLATGPSPGGQSSSYTDHDRFHPLDHETASGVGIRIEGSHQSSPSHHAPSQLTLPRSSAVSQTSLHPDTLTRNAPPPSTSMGPRLPGSPSAATPFSSFTATPHSTASLSAPSPIASVASATSRGAPKGATVALSTPRHYQNPVQVAQEAIAAEGLVDLASASDATLPESALPDVGLSPHECQEEFDFFFTHIHPWSICFSLGLDTHAASVRRRAPLLFCCILVTALYFRERTPRNIAVYRTTLAHIDARVAHTILCPQKNDLGIDLIKALHIITIYKPVQHALLEARGVQDGASVEQVSKMNVLSSWMLRGLLSKIADFVDLPGAASVFLEWSVQCGWSEGKESSGIVDSVGEKEAPSAGSNGASISGANKVFSSGKDKVPSSEQEPHSDTSRDYVRESSRVSSRVNRRKANAVRDASPDIASSANPTSLQSQILRETRTRNSTEDVPEASTRRSLEKERGSAVPEAQGAATTHLSESHEPTLTDITGIPANSIHPVIANQRLLLACVFHEAQGGLQSGRPSNFSLSHIRRTTRVFADLPRELQQSGDVRLSASVELFLIAADLLRARRDNECPSAETFATFAQEYAAWSSYWAPRLALEVESGVDPLAHTAVHPYANFIHVVVYGFVFSRWRQVASQEASEAGDAADVSGVHGTSRKAYESRNEMQREASGGRGPTDRGEAIATRDPSGSAPASLLDNPLEGNVSADSEKSGKEHEMKITADTTHSSHTGSYVDSETRAFLSIAVQHAVDMLLSLTNEYKDLRLGEGLRERRERVKEKRGKGEPREGGEPVSVEGLMYLSQSANVQPSLSSRYLEPTPQWTLDTTVTGPFKWASDSLTSVVYYYTAMFLVQMFNAGIIDADLCLCGSRSLVPAHVSPTSAFARLIDLAAAFLAAVSPNEFHPSQRQAQSLQKIRESLTGPDVTAALDEIWGDSQFEALHSLNDVFAMNDLGIDWGAVFGQKW